ncbi:MAG: hypothetical protein ACREMD_15495 [Gemmatimonadota bacterium]
MSLIDVPDHRRSEVARGCVARLAAVLEDLRAEHARAQTRLEFADPISPYNSIGDRLYVEKMISELLIENVLELIEKYSHG